MAEGWGNNSNFSTATSSLSQGRSYGKGRGFVPRSDDNSSVGQSTTNDNFDWGTSGDSSCVQESNGNYGSTSDNNSNEWGTTIHNDDDDGGGGGGGDNTQTFNNNDWGNYNQTQSFDDADDDNSHGNGNRGNFRGGKENNGPRRNQYNNNKDEGGYGGNRGDRGQSRNYDREGMDDEYTGGNGEEKKPPITYIPPERSMDDDQLFGGGVTAGINFSKYDDIKVEVSGDDVPPPFENFDMTGLRSSLVANIKKSGYNKPTPVQKYSIPIMMHGRDLMSCAQTGSGKTAAYLIPILHKLLENNTELRLCERGCEPQVVIMAPTRELVTQICWEAQKFAKDTIIKAIAVYGGVATMHQVRQLERGAHIIVATPGRLCDFVERGRINFSSINFVVLDEADRMLDQGFLLSMEKILEHETMVPTSERQTAMFSATFPFEVQNLASRFMKNYLFLRVGIVGGACEDVEQNFYEVEKKCKRRKLQELLNLDGGVQLNKKTLVFVETKKTADFIAAYMSDNKFPSTSIHGDREQRERDIALNDFKMGKMKILVATSVAARGLDIPEVAHVINYDLPKCIDEYVHRIGRTGRMGNKGKATSFYDPDSDRALAPDIVRMLKQAKCEIPQFLQGIDSGFDGGVTNDFGGYDIRGTNHENAAVEPIEKW